MGSGNGICGRGGSDVLTDLLFGFLCVVELNIQLPRKREDGTCHDIDSIQENFHGEEREVDGDDTNNDFWQDGFDGVVAVVIAEPEYII